MPHSLLRSFERSVGFLNTVSSSELLPAAVWLCDNGRYLQEEIASLRLTLQGLSALPQSSERSIPRVSIFARELLGHSTADFTLAHFRTAADAWQRVLPFSVEESNALPAAFKFTLLVLLTEMAQECAQEQKCRLAAVRTERLIRHDREKQALRLFQRYKHESAYLEQLLCKVRTQPGSKQPFWLESYFSEHAPASDTMAKAEHDHQAECCQWVSNAVTSLRAIGRLPWQRVLEDLSPLHAALCSDEIYPQMDRESRAYYRACVARLARRSGRSEQNVYETALSLAQNIKTNDVRAHVGYYLLDEGVETLMRRLQLNRLTQRLYRFTLHHAFGLARFGSWLAFAFLLIWARLMHLPFFVWLPLGAVFLYSAQQFVIARLQKHITPRLVPRMRVERLNEQTQTLVVCPTMLLNAKHALAMVKHLSVLHEANPDPHLHFLLLGDFQDSLTGTLSGDEDIVTTADTAIRALCESSGHPFFYLQRERVFADHIHMSRERKRGGVETLLCLVDGRPIEDRFVHATFAPETLKGKYRYVITLDSDTILPWQRPAHDRRHVTPLAAP